MTRRIAFLPPHHAQTCVAFWHDKPRHEGGDLLASLRLRVRVARWGFH